MSTVQQERATQAHDPDPEATGRTRSRYRRIAPIYDASEILAERRYRPWRRRLWSLARGPRILEVGVGTGKNLPFYPAGTEVTAVDLTPAMLRRARRRAAALGLDVDLREGDVQALELPDDHFDTAVATFVFCSVPDPELGLRELGRVVKPGGHATKPQSAREHGASRLPVREVRKAEYGLETRP